MRPKFCIRCRFSVPAKSKLCPICGSKQFAVAEAAVLERALDEQDGNGANSVSGLIHEFAEEVSLTMMKSARAWHKMKRLIRGAD